MADIGYKDAIDIREGEMMDISNQAIYRQINYKQPIAQQIGCYAKYVDSCFIIGTLAFCL